MFACGCGKRFKKNDTGWSNGQRVCNKCHHLLRKQSNNSKTLGSFLSFHRKKVFDNLAKLLMSYEDWMMYHALRVPLIHAVGNENDDILLERLTTHHYDTAVQLAKEFRTMKGVKLVDCFEQHLKSLNNYKEAFLKIFTNVPHLQEITPAGKLFVVVPDLGKRVHSKVALPAFLAWTKKHGH
eukprot:Pompholyxophrys_punicea_v1_NODE_355_length_2174_cov_4.135849.p2 type:complete len:182 gc:universal NODE_355_length_2174_cov_4.135849:1793-1248(-)